MANIWNNAVIRRDLNMPVGLVASQVAHIVKGFMIKRILDGKDFTNDELEWMRKPYLNILAVDNLEELNIVIGLAKDAGIQVNPWIDTIPSTNLKRVMDNVLVGASFGPDDMDRLKIATGTLPRL